MRGLASTGVMNIGGDWHTLSEHSKRGKRSLGRDLTTPERRDVLHKIAATAVVFLTNKRPSVRTKLNISVEQIREHNPNIIYVRGTGQGERGPDADKGSYDSLAFWARAGIALGCNRPEYDEAPPPPSPGFGDSLGAMTIAGGIMGALFHREKTGTATTVDVSLLSTGLWAMGQAIALSDLLGMPWGVPKGDNPTGNPLVNVYKTSDDRFVSLTCLQGGKYWPEFCELAGRPELATDERFTDHATLIANSKDARDVLADELATARPQEWQVRPQTFTA